jgi:tetratricopeptide (TPR) repeat protein
MANWPRRTNPSAPRPQLSIPLLVVAAFALGAGATWLAMRGSSATPEKPATASQSVLPGAEPPDVAQLAPGEAARTLANWNYDRRNWSHAIEHYEEAIARGTDNPDVHTDLGNCFRFLGQPQKALAQYEIAQKQDPQHENSLFNQAGLFAEMLHDNERAIAVAREFITRFPQSPRAESARQMMNQLQRAKTESK